MIAELFELLPLESAMSTLRTSAPRTDEAHAWVGSCQTDPVTRALLWLYVDDLDAAHHLVQEGDTAISSYIHGVVHRREGDYWNSKYWFSRAGGQVLPDFDAKQFVDRVEHGKPEEIGELINLQRQEWQRLFDLVERNRI